MPVGVHERGHRNADHARALGQFPAERGAVVDTERRGIRDHEVPGLRRRNGEAGRGEPVDEHVALGGSAAAASAKNASGRSSPTAIAGWNGAPFTYVRYCLTASTAVTSGAGAVSQPIFHPVVEKVLPPDEIETVRSQAPGRAAIGRCGTPKREVLVHLVGDDDRVVASRELDDELEDLVVEHHAGRVVRRVHDDEPGAVGDRGAQLVGVGSPVGRVKRSGTVRCTPPARAMSAA